MSLVAQIQMIMYAMIQFPLDGALSACIIRVLIVLQGQDKDVIKDPWPYISAFLISLCTTHTFNLHPVSAL